MLRSGSKPRRLAGLLMIAVIIVAAVIILAPNAFAAGIGRLVADLWITVMSAVAGLIGGIFGG